jgi:hypothetical protein
VIRRRIKAAVRLDRPAVLAEFHHILSHEIPPGWRLSLPALGRDDANRKIRPASGTIPEHSSFFRVHRENH